VDIQDKTESITHMDGTIKKTWWEKIFKEVKFYETMSVSTYFYSSGTQTVLQADNQRLQMDEITLIRLNADYSLLDCRCNEDIRNESDTFT
jgi:hypothetical protein